MSQPKKVEYQNPNVISRISAGMNVNNAVITLEHDLRIDGRFNGTLTSTARIIIGEGSYFTGELICNNLDVWGKIEGKVIVKDCLSMKKGCDISGEIFTNNIVSELGAKLNGTTKILEGDAYDNLTKENTYLHPATE